MASTSSVAEIAWHSTELCASSKLGHWGLLIIKVFLEHLELDSYTTLSVSATKGSHPRENAGQAWFLGISPSPGDP